LTSTSHAPIVSEAAVLSPRGGNGSGGGMPATPSITSNDVPTFTAAPIVAPPIRRTRLASAPLMSTSSASSFVFAPAATSAFSGARSFGGGAAGASLLPHQASNAFGPSSRSAALSFPLAYPVDSFATADTADTPSDSTPRGSAASEPTGGGGGAASAMARPTLMYSPSATAITTTSAGSKKKSGEAQSGASRADDNTEYQLFWFVPPSLSVSFSCVCVGLVLMWTCVVAWLGSWMKLAIKLDLAAHGNLGDDIDKNVLYEQLLRDAVPINEWPRRIVEALERRSPPRPTSAVQTALAPPQGFNR
jgi:hypothetical protein